MMCVTCKIFKPRITSFFNVNTFGKNFKTCEPGHETLSNSTRRPCKACYSILDKKIRQTKDAFVKYILRPYKK